MSSYVERLKQVGELAASLEAAFAEECRLSAAEARSRAEELSAEIEQLRVREGEAQSARQSLEQELDVAQKRIESLVQKLKDARQAAADAVDEAQKTLRRQLEEMQEECDEARAELEQERSVRKRLERGAAADDKRLKELEKELEGRGAPLSAAEGDNQEAAGLRAELDEVLASLDEALAALEEERKAREGGLNDLAETRRRVEALEHELTASQSALQEAREMADEAPPAEVVEVVDDTELRKLQALVQSAGERLELERIETKKQAQACAAAERRIAELEEALRNREGSAGTPMAVPKKPAVDALLPHELRPAPKSGALFRPDWDLNGLPCKGPEQVLQAWSSVFNVQLSLEGYPSQFCSAFLAVLKVGKQKQLFVMFNLKASKHILVCVPSKPPTDDASLNKALDEGRKYLLMSGFELEKIDPSDIERVLGGYFGAN